MIDLWSFIHPCTDPASRVIVHPILKMQNRDWAAACLPSATKCIRGRSLDLMQAFQIQVPFATT